LNLLQILFIFDLNIDFQNTIASYDVLSLDLKFHAIEDSHRRSVLFKPAHTVVAGCHPTVFMNSVCSRTPYAACTGACYGATIGYPDSSLITLGGHAAFKFVHLLLKRCAVHGLALRN
jgi:hypothetical protein